MGDDGSEKMPRPSPYADDSDDDAETRATLLDNGVKSAGGTERLDGMAAADRIEAENGASSSEATATMAPDNGKDHSVVNVPARARRSKDSRGGGGGDGGGFYSAKKRAGRLVESGASRVRTKSFWFEKLPFLGFLFEDGGYDLDKLTGDCIAGLTTALTVIPQGIGYAPLAGLPLQYGLYASIVPGFLYTVFGTIKEVTIGPTAVNALISYNYAGPSPARALTLAFWTGVIQISLAFFKMGFLLNFVSAPVISAFTSTVAIQVATSQVKGLLGLKVPGRGFVNTWVGVFTNIKSIRPGDAAVGFACIGILLFLRKFKDFRWCEGSDLESGRARFLRKAKWLVSISRNCLIVLLCAVMAYYLVEVAEMRDVLILTGNVEGGIPSFQPPWHFGLNATEIASPELPGPLDIARHLGIGLAMMPLVANLQQLAIAKFYTPPTARVHACQEMFALGACNLVGSFVGSMPVVASLGRSAVNAASGARTTFGGCVTGLIILAACAFLTPHFAYIPTCALAAVIISAMIFTIDIDILLPMWKSKKLDFVPYTVTFALGLFVSVEVGLIAGTATHLCILLFKASKAKVKVEERSIEDDNGGGSTPYYLVVPDRALFFPSVSDIRTRLGEAATPAAAPSSSSSPEADHVERKSTSSSSSSGCVTAVLLDMHRVADMDYTAASALRALAKQMKKTGQASVYFCNVSEDIEAVLQGADPSLFVSYLNISDAEQKIRNSS